MELSFALINSQNIRAMSKELLIFLEKADADFKAQCSSRMVHVAERYATSIRWRLDTLLSVLIAVGAFHWFRGARYCEGIVFRSRLVITCGMMSYRPQFS